jgi:SNF2 family DNA or RNA helicase
LKIGHALVWGKARDPIGQLQKFKTDASVQLLVINTRSGSSSLNLQHANYVVFFEQPDNPIDRQQAERRVWRPGQLKRVFIYDLLCKATKDHALYHSNKAGEDLLKSIIAGRTKL